MNMHTEFICFFTMIKKKMGERHLPVGSPESLAE